MIYNPLLNENVFEIEYLQSLQNENSDNNYIRSLENENKRKIMDEQFNTLIQNCEDKIKLLSLENDNLKKALEQFENIQKNYEQEKTNYIKKLLDNKKQFDELQNQFKQASKEFQNKINLLEEENVNLKSNFKDYELKYENISQIKEELNYKNSIIRYLEGLLKRTTTNPKLYTEDTYKEEFQRDKDSLINDNNYYFEDENSNQSENEYYNKKKSNQKKYSSLEFEKFNHKKKKHKKTNTGLLNEKDFRDNKPKQIKKDIDTLDQEIFELQSKLKKMLNK